MNPDTRHDSYAITVLSSRPGGIDRLEEGNAILCCQQTWQRPGGGKLVNTLTSLPGLAKVAPSFDVRRLGVGAVGSKTATGRPTITDGAVRVRDSETVLSWASVR